MHIRDKVLLWRQYFQGRSDVFASKRKEPWMDRPKYSPVVKDLKAKTISEMYIPLSREHIEAHIKGDMELMIYLLDIDNNVNFATIDFDLNHNFEDVLKVYDIITNQHKFSSAIARSTKKGHHLYLFFKEKIKANIVVSYIRYVYELLGWMDDLANNIRCLPETFPKTVSLGEQGVDSDGNIKFPLGFGVKPPMWGKGLAQSRNCWVELNDKPIGDRGDSEKQWEYMASIERIDPANMISFLNHKGVDILDARLSEVRGVVSNSPRDESGPYRKPDSGDLKRVIDGCPAMSRLWYGTPRDKVGHYGHVSLLSWALHCENGLEIINDYWKDPETGELSHEAKKQIDYGKRTFQKPWTCEKMQAWDLCVKGRDPRYASGKTVSNTTGEVINDFCFKKKPPKEIENGTFTVNPHNLSEEKWPSPSPIRLKEKYYKWGYLELLHAIESLSKDDPDLSKTVSNIVMQIQLIKNRVQREELKQKLKDRKVIKVKEIKGYEQDVKEGIKEDNKKKKREEQEKARKLRESKESELNEDPNAGEILGKTYYNRTDSPGYSVVTIDRQGEANYEVLTNFTVEIKESITKKSVFMKENKILKGQINMAYRSYEFEINAELYGNNSAFCQALFSVAGSNVVFEQKNLDRIRACICLFGHKNTVEKFIYEDHGYSSIKTPSLYRSGDVNITPEGITSVEDGKTCIDENSYARHLGLADISDEDFREVVNVIKNDFLGIQDPIVMYTALAHTIQASIHGPYIDAFLPKKISPLLWITGVAGTGKSVVAGFCQMFYGNFPNILHIESTARSLHQDTMFFKDSVLIFDDFKDALSRDKMLPLIQGIYDRAPRGRLTSSLRHAVSPFCRGLVFVTAEDIFSGESSVLSRCIVVRAKKRAYIKKDDDRMNKISSYQDLFRGVTAKFIHYMMTTHPNPKDTKSMFMESIEYIKVALKGKPNEHRIANNLGANFFSWCLFMQFLLQKNLISRSEYQGYIEEHRKNVLALAIEMSGLCGEEQAGQLFINTLNQAVLSGEADIIGLESINVKSYSMNVGFLDKPRAGEPLSICLHPQNCVRLVKRILKEKGSPMSHGEDAIGMQLLSEGYIVRATKGPILRKQEGNRKIRVWCINAEKAGFIVSEKSIFNDSMESREDSNLINPSPDFWSLDR
jgi:hypothetical protein